MKFYGNIDLTDNEMQQMVMQTETNFPDVPKPGRIVFKGKRVYICIEIASGTPAWVPLTNEVDSYVHTETSLTTTWNVIHNLNTTTPLVQLYDENYSQIIPDSIEIVSNNEILVTMGDAMQGRAIVMMGSTVGAPRSEFSFEYTQAAPALEWVIDHGLGYYPIVRVFVDNGGSNEEIQPESIVHNSLFQTTISFSSVRSGFAKFV